MKIAIIPAGNDAEKLYSILNETDKSEVVCFADNNANKIGRPLSGTVDINVVSPFKLKSSVSKGEIDRVLISSSHILSYNIDEITRQLDTLGIECYSVVPSYIFRKGEFDKDNNYKGGLDKDDYNNIFTPKGSLKQLQHLQFHVTDNCNLKCKGCQHFSNIVSGNHFPEYASVERDFIRLTELFDNINSIAILGGEPLLNKELPDYCNLVRKSFPYAEIELITNGLLIRQMSESLIEVIKKNNILVNISYYPPLSSIVDDVTEFLLKNEIRYYIGSKIKYFLKKMSFGGGVFRRSIYKMQGQVLYYAS